MRKLTTCESCAYSMTEGRKQYECVNPESRKHGQIVGRPTLRVISEFIAPKYDMTWDLSCRQYRRA